MVEALLMLLVHHESESWDLEGAARFGAGSSEQWCKITVQLYLTANTLRKQPDTFLLRFLKSDLSFSAAFTQYFFLS